MRGRPYIGGLTRSPGGDRPPLSPAGGAAGPSGACRLGPLVGRPWGGRQGPVARWGGDRPPLFFFSRDFVANLKKKITLSMGGRPGYIFEIFQNGHIFLKF